MIKELVLDQIFKEQQKCFGGAWYHKVMSIPYDFSGIEGVITLPMPHISRFRDEQIPNSEIDFDLKNLDVSSIYMGGHATNESDVGLALSAAILNGNITKGSAVFRPFWRYITDQVDDSGPYDFENKRYYSASVLNNQEGIKNVYAHYHPSFTEYYYLPGDKLRLSLTSPKPHYLVLKIEVLEVSVLDYSVNFRSTYNLKKPENFTSPLISSPGHGTSMIKTYKRVNAIDQVANEGKEAIMTNTTIKNAIWHECYLHYLEDGQMYKTPFNNNISVTMSCPDSRAFLIDEINDKTGGQKITIKPNEVNS